MKFAVWITVSLLGALLGCAGQELPRTQIAASMAEPQASIRAAEEANAANYPRSAMHLRLAEEQFEAGRQAMQDGRDRDASRLFERSQMDAELALTLAQAIEAENQEGEVTEELLRLRGQEPAVTPRPVEPLPPGDEPTVEENPTPPIL